MKMPGQKKEGLPYKEKKCPNEGCNPFVPCPMGSCCYLVENFISNTTIPILKKEKNLLFDDNSLSNVLSECWHPPESVS